MVIFFLSYRYITKRVPLDLLLISEILKLSANKLFEFWEQVKAVVFKDKKITKLQVSKSLQVFAIFDYQSLILQLMSLYFEYDILFDVSENMQLMLLSWQAHRLVSIWDGKPSFPGPKYQHCEEQIKHWHAPYQWCNIFPRLLVYSYFILFFCFIEVLRWWKVLRYEYIWLEAAVEVDRWSDVRLYKSTDWANKLLVKTNNF